MAASLSSMLVTNTGVPNYWNIQKLMAKILSMSDTWQNFRSFTEDEVERITNNYGTPIGKGGFGEVYKGILDDDYDPVAVKRYIRENLRKEFMEEVSIHSQMSHNNVVKLIGYCIGESTLSLVTEYISKGNLDDILHNSDTAIPLDIRLGIAIGCAEALSYMHSMHLSSDSLICHGDIKPANILLNENFTAKVSDFGLSRLLSGGITHQYTSKVIGSIDYMDPVYLHAGRLTPRNDVYSFGIVLLELVTRKRVKQGDMNLIGIFDCAKGKGLRKLFDASIANKNTMEILEEIVKLAKECFRLDSQNRPQMNNVAKRLRMLKRDLKGRQESTHSQSILETHNSWHKKEKQDNPQIKKSFSFFNRNASNSKTLSEFSNVRSFTKEELKEITENYSYLLGGGMLAKFYKGTLEDNTAVVVRKFLHTDSKEAFINGGIVLSRIVHKNIIKLLGCCLETETLIFIYEYADKGSLLDILGSQEDFPLDIRMMIAIKTAEALQYLHSSATGIIGHGSVAASTIVLDNNFRPKLTDFSGACKLIKDSGNNASESVVSNYLLEKVLFNDSSHFKSVLMNLESDVYRFGGVLLALISRESNTRFDDLVVEFTKAYRTDNSGKAMFDKDIISEHDITVLEEIGTLALKCTILNADEMVNRPTMKEVAEQLRMIRRTWKKRTTEADTQVTQTKATTVMPMEPRIPYLMRHMFGYRRISTSDPIRIR
ncbi:Wall-associated receptor kinase 3 [Dichanthelium oligosanthes]|uniref:Wall-associated receptor kinase 3 n=1 Tax=Dichanthelium oligosanthes TaxID=888268 RepID=A0A1E5VZU9_9POAL|nr:Wall-associated receptor kinase 3 [Dichanthelium oligosanthes]